MRYVVNQRTKQLFLTCTAGILLAAAQTEAIARPPLLQLFVRQYQHLQPQVQFAKCRVCHEATSVNGKKPLNIYGTALKQVIPPWKEQGEPNPQNVFEAIEDQPSAIKGKTFGDLIKEGKLPASTE